MHRFELGNSMHRKLGNRGSGQTDQLPELTELGLEPHMRRRRNAHDRSKRGHSDRRNLIRPGPDD